MRAIKIADRVISPREAQRERHRKWCEANPERLREHRRKWREKFKAENPDLYREQNKIKAARWYSNNRDKQLTSNQKANLKRHYGMTPADYDAMLTAQDGKCALCDRVPGQSLHKRLYVDHDHATSTIRGLLCYRCNAALGQLGDNLAGLKRAVDYVLRAERHGRKIA